MNYYDNLMFQYYRVLNNAWRAEIKQAATLAITLLYEARSGRPAAAVTAAEVNQVMSIIGQNLGTDFAAAVTAQTKTYIDRSLRLGLQDVRSELRGRVSIGLWGIQDQYAASILEQQQLFWLGNHFDADIASSFRATLQNAFSQGLTRDALADALKQQFQDLGAKSDPYWQGLAEHTALRVREFGRLNGYEKAGAQYYRLVNPMDDRTSEICRVLVGSGRIYPLAAALEVRNNLLAIDMQEEGLEAAREHIKALAPWVKDSQIERDAQGNPTGVSGAHTPFPPFHWKCRTTTEIVL